LMLSDCSFSSLFTDEVVNNMLFSGLFLTAFGSTTFFG
jgi:hypothetical protein